MCLWEMAVAHADLVQDRGRCGGGASQGTPREDLLGRGDLLLQRWWAVGVRARAVDDLRAP